MDEESTQLQLLDSFRLIVAGRPRAVSRPAQRVLAFLAVHRGVVPRSALGQRLWDDAGAPQAAANLRATLWRMPRPGGRPLVTSAEGAVALGGHVGVDWWSTQERAHVMVGAVDTAERHPPSPDHMHAVEVLADDLLPEWDDDWLLVHRESYRQLRLHALERLSDTLLDDGRYVHALGSALAAVRVDPLRESAHRRVVAVHLAEENPAEALRQYHAYRRLLAAELGVPPSAAIRDQVASLLGRPLERARRNRQPGPA
ncbi:MAG: AfsR/SARP family transcriptional regulator [Phycicoccus sp.]